MSKPSLVAFNGELAKQLGLSFCDPLALDEVEVLVGNRVPEGLTPVALAYAGHQFGNFVPQLGDGRALLLGEVVTEKGRFDVQLKGSGRTPFSRGGDGRAALGPVLREYLVSEAMAALGVPTTRSLAAVATGDSVLRDTALPGAVLTRVASSHLRVGTFQYFAVRNDREALLALTRYALSRHYPDALGAECHALGLLDAVIVAQANLVARWQSLGFVHGVMNTDNVAISGETIDYGPCAFLDTFVPQRSFSSIDRWGRYAYVNQPRVMQWNLARLAEALLPIIEGREDDVIAQLRERVESFETFFNVAYVAELRSKLGLTVSRDGDAKLSNDLLQLMADEGIDYTLFFRNLCDWVSSGDDEQVASQFRDPTRFVEWACAYRARLLEETASTEERVTLMRRHNPAFIPRNHRVEEVISAALDSNFAPFERLCRVLARPYDDQPEDVCLAEPPGEEQWEYRTFCGT